MALTPPTVLAVVRHAVRVFAARDDLSASGVAAVDGRAEFMVGLNPLDLRARSVRCSMDLRELAPGDYDAIADAVGKEVDRAIAELRPAPAPFPAPEPPLVDLAELERKARAASGGPWRWRPGNEALDDAAHQVVLWAQADDNDDPRLIAGTGDAEHIAANSPDVTLMLIERIRELEHALGETADLAESLVEGPRISLKARLAQMRALITRGIR
ncbi:MAG TPA: hypothetical protein VJU58_06125 [Microbacterium sp.]|nr:hypothetical protein [Microbacterium sp.]